MVEVLVRELGDHRRARRAFHRSEDCIQLRKAPARGVAHPLAKIELDDLLKESWVVVPCRNCYPDAPRIEVAKRHCPRCNKRSARACAHNGGVPVVFTITTSYRSWLREPGDELQVTRYVWPHLAHHYYKSR